jgi:hypothetical protein
MKKLVLLLTAGLLVNMIVSGNPLKKESVFRNITKDLPSGGSVLIFSVKTISKTYDVSQLDVLFSNGNTVYSCPLNLKYLTKNKENKVVTTEVFSFSYAVPGTYDLNLVEVETKNGPYISSVRYPFQGSFTLEAGTINYLGEIIIDLTSSGSALAVDQKNSSLATEKFAREYPAIFNSAGNKVNTIHLLESHPCETGDIIFSEDLSQNNGEWKVTNNEDQKVVFSESGVKIDNQKGDSCLVTRRIDIPENFDISIETTWNGGDPNKSFGLMIGNEETQCLKFSVTGGGYCSIFRWDYVKKSSSRPLKMWSPPNVVGWSKSAFLNTNPGDKNILRVQKTSWSGFTIGVIAFYINDKLIARNIYYVTPPSGGYAIQFNKNGIAGMFTFGKQAVTFSNLKMSSLK